MGVVSTSFSIYRYICVYVWSNILLNYFARASYLYCHHIFGAITTVGGQKTVLRIALKIWVSLTIHLNTDVHGKLKFFCVLPLFCKSSSKVQNKLLRYIFQQPAFRTSWHSPGQKKLFYLRRYYSVSGNPLPSVHPFPYDRPTGDGYEWW